MPRSSKTSEELMAELEEIFLNEGFHAVTLRDLAKRLGCAYRRIYAIAPTKEALFLKISDRYFSRIKRDGWEQANTDKPLVDRIGDYLRVGVIAARRMKPDFNEDINNLPAGRVMFDSHQEERIRGLTELLTEGFESGEFKGFHPKLVAEVMIASVKRVRQPDFLVEADMEFAEALNEISRLVRFGIAAPDRQSK